MSSKLGGTMAQQMKHLLNDEKCIKSLFKSIARTCSSINTFGDVTPLERAVVDQGKASLNPNAP
ncbi:hypothetical protein BDR04DRAFT_1151612 [Suillus decipiens]|nr:hypothetical protein BDR04DRAFT_1151612 [Suillus decipiens]